MINPPKFWYSKTFFSKLMALLFFPIACIYKFGFYIDSLIKKNKIENINAVTVAIGGVNLGGSGKTPITIEIVKFLQSKNKNVAVISRGYHKKTKDNFCSNDFADEPFLIKSNYLGDEGAIISKYATVFSGANKLISIKNAISKGFDYLVMDDSLQTHYIKKNFSILVVDELQGFGNGFSFPSGPLRESKNSAIQKSDLIILVKNGKHLSNFSNHDLSLIHQKPVIECSFKNNISNLKVFAFCGIGYPEKFFNTLEINDNEICERKIFPDHHSYSDDEIFEMIEIAKKKNLRLVTTEKDIVKINEKFYNDILIAKLEVVFRNFDESVFEKIF